MYGFIDDTRDAVSFAAACSATRAAGDEAAGKTCESAMGVSTAKDVFVGGGMKAHRAGYGGA